MSDYVIIEGTPWSRNASCPTVLCRGGLKTQPVGIAGWQMAEQNWRCKKN